MPTLFRSGKVLIRMFGNDHDPPHFHIWTPDMDMQIVLADLSTLRGSIRKRDYDTAMAWARENQFLLQATWNELNGR